MVILYWFLFPSPLPIHLGLVIQLYRTGLNYNNVYDKKDVMQIHIKRIIQTGYWEIPGRKQI